MKHYLSLLLGLLLILTSCANSQDLNDNDVFTWNLGSEPNTIDPTYSGDIAGSTVIRHTFEGLIRESNGISMPGIAKSWDISENQKVITFNLRESLWSDGSPLTSSDFVFAWERAINPKTGSTYASIWEFTNIKGISDYIAGTVSFDKVGIYAPDDLTLVIELIQPTDYLLSFLSNSYFMPLQESNFNSGHSDKWASTKERAISNGPFILENYTLNESIKLIKNANYWDADNVDLYGINFLFIENENTSYMAYENGETHGIANVPNAKVSTLKGEDNNFHIAPLLGTFYFNFNLSHDMWSDVRIRKAFNLAIDRQAIVDTLARNQIPATQFVSPGFIDNDGNDFRDYDSDFDNPIDNSRISEAQELIAEAGYTNGDGFPTFELLYNTSDNNRMVAEMVQEMLKTNLGINCKLAAQEWGVYIDARVSGNFQYSKGSWTADFLDPISMLGIFTSNNPLNASNYSNKNYDQLIEEAINSVGSDKAKLLHDAETILMTDLPIVPIYHYTDIWLINESVINWSRSSFGIMDFSKASFIE